LPWCAAASTIGGEQEARGEEPAVDAHRRRLRAVAAAAVAVVVAILLASSGGTDGDRGASAGSPTQPERGCPVTVPNDSTPPGQPPTGTYHGNGKLWTISGSQGTFVVARKSAPEYLGPGGEIAVDGILAPDGSVAIKAPWWRGPGVRGRLRLQARRLDAPAPPVDRTISPHGYGLTGLQAMGLSLPTVGCWKVTGSVGEASLTFVTLVRKARAEQ
jgi:hypothetical protein